MATPDHHSDSRRGGAGHRRHHGTLSLQTVSVGLSLWEGERSKEGGRKKERKKRRGRENKRKEREGSRERKGEREV